MKRDDYIPVLVERNNKKVLWRFDFTNLSIAELCEIKEKIQKYEPYTKTIILLDKLIRQKTDELMPYNKAYGKSYVKTYKEHKKEEKNKRLVKTRRKKYDKYQR